jgi:hypothetical protein
VKVWISLLQVTCAYAHTNGVEIHSFALFEDTILNLRVDEVEPSTTLGAKIFKGAVVSASEADSGTFTISVYDGAVAASFTLEEEEEEGVQTYSVGGHPQMRGAFVAHQTDRSRYLPVSDVVIPKDQADQVEMSNPDESSFQTRSTASSVTGPSTSWLDILARLFRLLEAGRR